MSNNQSISTFRRSPYSIRRKQIDHFIIEQENNIQSIGDTPFIHDLIEQIIIQPSVVINSNDYIYMIYLLLLIIFYIYYLIIILQNKTNLFDDYYFDNYEREIPRLLWFKRGYQLY
jgi:hypothetical protein